MIDHLCLDVHVWSPRSKAHQLDEQCSEAGSQVGRLEGLPIRAAPPRAPACRQCRRSANSPACMERPSQEDQSARYGCRSECGLAFQLMASQCPVRLRPQWDTGQLPLPWGNPHNLWGPFQGRGLIGLRSLKPHELLPVVP